MSRRAEICLLAIILAIAALLRFLWLETVPAGWHHDEAMMGIMASEVYRGLDRPIFFPAYLGQEPLYLYLSAGVMWLLGGDQGILAPRLASAILGLATVIVTYLLGRELFDRRVGLISAALLGFSFWQVLLSRDAYRVVTQPLLEGLTILLLWRASQRKSLWYYAAAGIAFGGTIYTYLGARVFPGVLLLFALWWLMTRGWPTARERFGLGLFVATAFIVAAPLLHYFATHPGTFFARATQLFVLQDGAIEQNSLLIMAKNFLKLLATFTVRDFGLWRFNIVGRPIFTALVGLLFYVGLIVAMRDTLRRQAASAMVLVWFGVMLLPCFLTVDVGGYALRAVGLAPALFLVPALGIVALWDWIVTRVSPARQKLVQTACATVVATILLAEAGITYRDYFVVWANNPNAAQETMTDIVAAAQFLDQEARPAEEDIFISSDYPHHTVIAHLAPRVYPEVRWFDGNSTVVFPSKSARPSLYVFPFSAFPEHLHRYMPTEALVERSYFTDGTTEMEAYRLTPDQVATTLDRILGDPTLTRTNANLGDEIELIAYHVDAQVKHGNNLVITAIWRILKDSPSKDYVIFSHLLNDKGGLYRQTDSTAFAAQEWRDGDVAIAQYVMDIKDWVPTGRYSVVVGVYDRATMSRLPVKGETPPTDTVRLDFVDVVAQE